MTVVVISGSSSYVSEMHRLGNAVALELLACHHTMEGDYLDAEDELGQV